MRRFILVPLALFFIFSKGYAQDEAREKSEEIFLDYLYEQGPGFSITVIKDDETVFQENYGLADIESNTSVSSDIKFNMGTLTSQFTAMGVMILKDRGRINYSDEISTYLSDLPEYAKHLTIEDLLEESSGLPNFSFQRQRKKYDTPEKVKGFLHTEDELSFEPGEKDDMNLANAALLTLIIEEVTEDDYSKFVQENIFEPLSMNNSEVYKGGWFYKIKNKAVGYRANGEGDENTFEAVQDIDGRNYLRGLTGLYSTSADLQKWLKAWEEDIFVEKKTLSKALRIGFIRGAKEFYGYGWRKGFNNGKKYLYQGGTGYGNTHIILKFPTENIEVVILSNQQSVFGMRAKAFELLNLFSDEEYEVK
ncbi:MAG: serine hydrolase domain-containing protein [Bacteroidales bacterium]